MPALPPPSFVTNLMMGTLAFDIMATTSVIYAWRIARASSASILPFRFSEKRLFDTTRSISLH